MINYLETVVVIMILLRLKRDALSAHYINNVNTNIWQRIFKRVPIKNYNAAYMMLSVVRLDTIVYPDLYYSLS
jgi:hypothetical protein